ncbi:hypothetical protein DIZ81_02985 [Legionella taurinensis]|uniref:Uncharacterized protein n=1 Tax=Legionella taurinensis TaxID=70611 RepID=A0A3A5L7V0_9GAMM|nr:hypothetical protein [Legionella taurinensis]MDX1836161.1 hypothetical protein [Legionella taurinensis]PUT42069.1 hypothetical protein DB744_02990 [Legionella taurinensis]PUT44856.1 hypothetical protein DB746_02990 [Legionella taurinensis]PUT48177.1 hypothetical protein DB743_01150 [Legionella taurinensis]PUT48991.1 hypothetical protein DB745_02990 [Legionella taurinensis]
MSGFFNNAINTLRPAAYSSSSGHRHTQRVQAVTEILGSGLQNLDVKAVIPAKFAQILIALFAMFRTDTHGSEKGVQFLQFALAATQLALIIALFAQDNNCDDETNELCKSKLLVDLFFEGLLAFSFALAEASKDETITPPQPAPEATQAAQDSSETPDDVSITISGKEKVNHPKLISDDDDEEAQKSTHQSEDEADLERKNTFKA